MAMISLKLSCTRGIESRAEEWKEFGIICNNLVQSTKHQLKIKRQGKEGRKKKSKVWAFHAWQNHWKVNKQLLIIRMEKPLSEMRKPTGKISSHSYFLPGYSTPLGNKPKSIYNTYMYNWSEPGCGWWTNKNEHRIFCRTKWSNQAGRYTVSRMIH